VKGAMSLGNAVRRASIRAFSNVRSSKVFQGWKPAARMSTQTGQATPKVDAATVAARRSARQRQNALAYAGVVIGHGITMYGYLTWDRVPIPGTEIETNVSPGLGYLAYAAITRGSGGVGSILFYIVGQALMSVVSVGSIGFLGSRWVAERTPTIGPDDIPDMLQLLTQLRAGTPEATKVDLTSGHITQTPGMDTAIIGGLRAFFACFEEQGGMTKQSLRDFLANESKEPPKLPVGIPLMRTMLSAGNGKIVDQLFRLMDYDDDGKVTFREFGFSALMTWAAMDGNPQAQQVVMFKLMDKDSDGKISKSELVPWVELLSKNGGIKEDELTVRCWHLLAFRDIGPQELANRYFSQFDKDSDGFITLEEFAQLSTKFTFSKVFDTMLQSPDSV